MRKFHVINDTNPQEFSRKLEEFCNINRLTANILYRTNTVQTIKKTTEVKNYNVATKTIEDVKTNYSALIQYQ